MENPAISIIIPVYKVEAYLQRCINSVLLQDFKNWEMILVDDGSPDNCPQICDQNARKDYRIKVIHKHNEGLPAARKSGFMLSKGRYIIHLDSDDYLLPNALSILHKKAIDGDYDIVKGCNYRFTNTKTFKLESPPLCNTEIIGSENYWKALIRHNIKPYIWGGIYKRELFEDCIYCFTSEVSICEDWITNQAIWRKVNKYIAISDVVYAYYINPKSMMQSKVLSHQYINKIGRIMGELTQNTSNEISHLIEMNRTLSHLRAFFIPELPWNAVEYNKIKESLSKKENKKYCQKYINKRFLIFIQNRYLFHLYSRLYAYLFKYIKLHGHNRKIL
mgnify:CR=1 FL=1